RAQLSPRDAGKPPLARPAGQAGDLVGDPAVVAYPAPDVVGAQVGVQALHDGGLVHIVVAGYGVCAPLSVAGLSGRASRVLRAMDGDPPLDSATAVRAWRPVVDVPVDRHPALLEWDDRALVGALGDVQHSRH